MSGAQINYTAPGQGPRAAAVAEGPPRAALDTVFGEGDVTFRVADGVVVLSSRQYNELQAKYGTAWNWCKAYGLRLVNAHQRDDGQVEVTVEEMAAHLARGTNPDGTDIPITPVPNPSPSPSGVVINRAKIIYPS